MGIGKLFDPTGFPPRWYCGDWSDAHGWLHILSDTTTWGAYTAIPLILGYFARRRSIPFPRVIWLFAAFILACGLTHLLEAIIFWYPVYRLSGVMKLTTAIVSSATVVALVRVVPEIIRLPAFGDLAEALTMARREREVAEARSRHLAVLVERSSDVILGLDSAGRIRSWNEAAARVLGYSSSEATGQRLRDYAEELHREGLGSVIDSVLAGAETGTVTATLRTSQGATVELELAVAHVGEAPGNPIAVAVVGRDVSERNATRRKLEEANRLLEAANQHLEDRVAERAAELQRTNDSLQREVAERRRREEELRESERRLEEAHRIARLGSWRWWPEEDHIEWSNTLFELFEFETGRAIGPREHHFSEVFTPAAGETLSGAVRRALEEHRPYEVELETVLSPPAPRFVRVKGRPHLSPSGGVELLEGTVLDVTETKLQEQALEASNRRLEQAVKDATAELRATVHRLELANADLEGFVHMASHDMQEPLRTLRNYSTLLRDDLEGELSSDAQDDLRFIEEAAGRMQRMIEALLELSHTGRREADRTEVRVSGVVAGVLEDYSKIVKARGATVEVESLPVVTADRSLLERVLSNLVSNALKFAAEEGPRVRIFAEETKEAWILGVADNGEGIDPEHVERAFQPFKRLSSGRVTPGTGMGLTICRKAVEVMGGRIWVERDPSGGASFRVMIPREGGV